MGNPARARARGAEPRAWPTRAATCIESIVSARAVSQRPMSWLKAAASKNLRRSTRRDRGYTHMGQGNATARGVWARRKHARLATRRRAGPAGSRGGERETYVATMFTTLAVSQSDRLLLKTAAPLNKDSIVFARDTFHLPARRECERARGVANRARAGGPQHQPPRLPGAPQRAAAWPHVVCAAAWLFRTRRPRCSRKPCLAGLYSLPLHTVTTSKAARAKTGRTR